MRLKRLPAGGKPLRFGRQEFEPGFCTAEGERNRQDRASVRPEAGAKAWRISLQINSPSVRQLHFGRLPDGGPELARVAVHDDLNIS